MPPNRRALRRQDRLGRKRRQPAPIPPLSPDETRVIIARHPAVLIEQVYAMTEHQREPTHRLSIVTGLPDTGGEWVAAILFPIGQGGE